MLRNNAGGASMLQHVLSITIYDDFLSDTINYKL